MTSCTSSRLHWIATAVIGTVLISMLFIEVQLPSSNQFVAYLGRISGLFDDDSTTFAAVKVEQCDDLLCKKYLTEKEWREYNRCVNETLHPQYTLSEGQLIEQDPTPCTFHNGTAKEAPTLLVSFPGSGNTWLRGLLQQVTGVCAGSHFCDIDLRRRGFPGDGVRGKSVIVVKAHAYNYPDHLQLIHQKEAETPVVFLIRNPFDALVAERTRDLRASASKYWNDTHTNSDVHESQFGTNPSWATFLTKNMKLWHEMAVSWGADFGGPLMVVKYEDLRVNTLSEVLRILDFVQFEYDEESVRRALVQDFSRYHRKKHANFSHYTPEQERTMLTMLDDVNARLRSKNRMDLLSMDEYKVRP